MGQSNGERSIYVRIRNYFYSHLFYSVRIEALRLHIGQPKSYLEQIDLFIPRTWATFYVPLGFMFYFGLNMALNVVFPRVFTWHPLLQLPDFMPKTGRNDFLITITIWSWMYVIYVLFARSTNLADYRFLAVWVVREPKSSGDLDPTPQIIPQDLGLTLAQYHKLSIFRRHMNRLLSYTVLSVVYVGWSVSCFESIRNHFWTRGPFYPFWGFVTAVEIAFWVLYSAPHCYGIPYIVITVVFYLWLKLRRIELIMKELNQELNHWTHSKVKVHPMVRARLHYQLIPIVRHYGGVLHEIQTYNRMVSRYLTELFLGWIMLITFITYLLFLTKQNSTYITLYTICQMGNVALISMCSLGGAQIAKFNRKLGRQMVQFYCAASRDSIGFSPRTLLKFQTITENILHKKIGFTLVDGLRVNTRIFFMIFIDISTFFFLVFKNHLPQN